MDKIVSRKNFRRVSALILAAVTILSVFFALPVGAKTGDKTTITFDYCYDTAGNIITFAKTVTNGSVTVGTPGEELCRIYADGKDAYCIEPGYSLFSGNQLTEGKSSVWDGVSAAKRKAINIALLYGKPGSGKNLSGTEGQKWIATQLIVWELMTGCRNTSEGFKCTNTKYIDGMCAGDKNPGVKSVYNAISKSMAAHNTVPSFVAVLASKAPTHTMEYKDGKYQITLTDSNGVLSKFAYKTSGNIAVSISGNKMTLATNSPITEGKTLSINKTVPSVSSNSVLVAHGDSSKQDVITGLAAPDPVPSIFKLKTNAGHLKIVKTSEDGVVADIQFTVTGTNYNQTAKTDKDGKISLTNLLPGTYTVTEAPSEKYEKQDPQTVKVEYGKTATVKFHNTIDRGTLDIIKTSEDGIVADIEFTVTGNNFNKTVKTDKNGKINIPNLLPGKYTVTEKTPDRYVNQQSQTVTVEYGKTATVSFKNVLKRSEIVIQKKDMESKKIIPLAGFGFQIKKADGTLVKADGKDTFYTDKTGTIKLPIQLTYGKYQLIEVKAGTGYVLDKKPIDFTVDGTKTVVTIEKYNKSEKGTITITKLGDIFKTVTEETVTAPTEETEATEPEATQSDDAKVTEPTEPSKPAEPTRPAEPTAPNGNPSAPQEPTKPQKPTEPTKTIFEDETTAPTEEVTEPEEITRYIPVFEESYLEGAEFEITAAEDIITPDGVVHYKEGEVVDTITTAKNGKAVSKQLYLGNYLIRETKSPYGFIKNSESYSVTLSYAGETVEVTNTDLTVHNQRERAEVSLKKILERYEKLNIGTETELTKVVFAIYANEDITAEDGKFLPKDGLIEIVYCDEEGNVKFETELPFGKYYVQEYSTDDHYVLDDTKYEFEFAYYEDLDVEEVHINEGKEIENKLKRGTVTTTKVDEEYPENKLSGAVFEIYADADGDGKFNADVDILIDTMTESETDKGNYSLGDLPTGGYFMYEAAAPEGFVKDDNYHYFEIDEDGDVANVENKAGVGFINKPIYGELEITKRDVATGKLLPNAGFRIKDENGNIVAEGYTDENGIAKFKLRYGKYTYEEFDAPDGYILDSKPYSFEITEDGQIVKAEMTNEKQPTPDTPQTGDDSNMGVLIGIGAVAVGGLIAFLIVKFKKRDEDDDD
ncbi:SpaA isopeptide-forming pilin-related protein [Ruminococcus sp.]|uniref:SpaA isopeptide-forming pilin-related protein n=1 Tax=Ruminococcus sp. TaxID=41978 RepID=UPI00389113E6